MARSTPGHVTRQRRKRTLKDASGYWGARGGLFRVAKQFVTKAGVYARRDRRTKKREFRALWVIRTAAAAEARGMSYSVLMGALRKANVLLNRKMLSEIAIADPAGFDKIIELAKKHAPKAA